MPSQHQGLSHHRLPVRARGKTPGARLENQEENMKPGKMHYPAKKRAATRATGTCEVHGDYLDGPLGKCPSCVVAERSRGRKSDPTMVRM